MSDKNSAVAVYDSHDAAEQAVQELQRSGFDMKKLSIVGKDYHTDEHVVGYYNAGDRMRYWGKAGEFWGGIFGLLFGSALFWVPGIGPLVGMEDCDDTRNACAKLSWKLLRFQCSRAMHLSVEKQADGALPYF